MMIPGEWEPRHPLRANLVASSQERRQPSAPGRADATGFAPILVHTAPSTLERPFWMRACSGFARSAFHRNSGWAGGGRVK